MAGIARIVRLIAREAILPPDIRQRVPEPETKMNLRERVKAFHEAGKKYLPPVYEFNAKAIAALAPANAHVLDLGCGSGVFLAYLSRHRPDLQITGIDLAEDMVSYGQEMLAADALTSRVKIACGDMTDLKPFTSQPINLVSSVFSLHHLIEYPQLDATLKEISRIVGSGASLWIFDHARPKREQTAIEFPDIFTPDADRAFCQDSSNSLRAAWSFDELRSALRTAELANVRSVKAQPLRLYQIHWIAQSPRRTLDGWVSHDGMDEATQSEARRFDRLFRDAPQRGLGQRT